VDIGDFATETNYYFVSVDFLAYRKDKDAGCLADIFPPCIEAFILRKILATFNDRGNSN